MTMENIFAASEEKFVKNVVLYAHSDNILYVDAEHTEPINRENLWNLCRKGLVVVFDTDSYYYPVSFKDNTTDVSVVIATSIDSSSSASKTLKSKESGEE